MLVKQVRSRESGDDGDGVLGFWEIMYDIWKEGVEGYSPWTVRCSWKQRGQGRWRATILSQDKDNFPFLNDMTL